MTRPAWRDATPPRGTERGAAGVERDCLQPGESREAGGRLALPKRIENWSLTSLQQRLVKAGGRVVKHAGYYWLLLAEGHLNRRRFGAMLRRIVMLPVTANLPLARFESKMKLSYY